MKNAGVVLLAALAAGCATTSGTTEKEVSGDWEKEFHLEGRHLVAEGENPYFVLKPGFQTVLESSDAKVETTVLNETEQVGGVTTRVVEERESENGEIVEISRNYFAIDADTKDVFYSGEAVDIYKHGKIVKQEGEWRADNPGQSAGLVMPGRPAIGDKFYQEIAPGVALDRAEITSLSEALDTPAGKFPNCLLTHESSGLNPLESEKKHYAPGIGQIQDEDLLLTKYGYVDVK